ncbi:G-protein coupled GABA receptor [Fragilaria crotonensis]|nr:G-protein coupled GABA receptor [Fragilaria crotonensis]
MAMDESLSAVSSGDVMVERDEIKAVDYFQNIAEEKLNSGDYQLLAPGVMQVTLDNRTTIFRHISIFHALTRSSASASSITSTSTTTTASDDWELVGGPDGMEQILAIVLAAHHFNNRATTDVVPSLSAKNNDSGMNALQECNVQFTIDVWDTQENPAFASTQLLLDVLPRSRVQSIESTIIRNQRRNVTNIDDELRKYPTGIIGALSSSTSRTMAILGGVLNLTQVSSFSTADELDYKDQFPFFGRTITPVSSFVGAGVEYFVHSMRASHVFIIYVRDFMGTSHFRSFQRQANEAGLITRSASVSTEHDLQHALDKLDASGYKYVFAVIYVEHYSIMLPQALQRGLAGKGMFWMYTDTFTFPALPPGDPLLEATHGSAILGFPEGPLLRGYGAFNDEWQRYIATAETQAYLTRILPSMITESPLYNYTIPPLPSGRSMFIYDAFMSLALSACDAAHKEHDTFSSGTFHNSFLNQAFIGATGTVRFDNVTGSRLQKTTQFVVSNLRVNDELQADGLINFSRSHVFVDNHSEAFGRDAAWTSLDNTSFIYADNTTVPPANLPPLDGDVQWIDLWSTLTGCIACLLIVGSAVGFCIWMEFNVKTGPVMASQPFFMRMVSGGVMLMAMCLIPQGVVPYVANPDAACMSGPWLLFTGFCVTFAAIFSKLRRINKIESFSNRMIRVTITPMQVLAPFAVLLTLNVSILTAWTIVDPLKYEKVALNSQDVYGRNISWTLACQAESNQATFFFYAALGILDIVALMICWWECFKARNTKVAYDENQHIVVALIVCSQSFLIGAPLMVVSIDPSVRYLGLTVAITFCSAGILFPIMSPKVSQVMEWKAAKAAKEARRLERRLRADAYFARVGGDKNSAPPPTPQSEQNSLTTNVTKPSVRSAPKVVFKPNLVTCPE